MITEILQPITGFISTKSEILSDDAAPRGPTLRPNLGMARTATTHHWVNGTAPWSSDDRSPDGC
jgi:hypothetical protein